MATGTKRPRNDRGTNPTGKRRHVDQDTPSSSGAAGTGEHNGETSGYRLVGVGARNIEVEEYIAEILKYKAAQEQRHLWDGKVPDSYSVTLEDGTKANVGEWVNLQRGNTKKRLRNGIKEKSLLEQRLWEIGILWNIRKIEVEEYVAEILKYKAAQEHNHPGKPWDGKVPESYSVTFEDGTKANVGTWVNYQRNIRKKRLRNGIKEISLVEQRLDEIGILWNLRKIDAEEYIAEILKYKAAQEQKHPGTPWDGNVPIKFSVTLEDGTKANVGEWVRTRKRDRKLRLEMAIAKKSPLEERLDGIGILWEVRRIGVEEYIAEIVKYKEAQEQKHPGKPWDGNVLRSYSVTLKDGTKANVGEWVRGRKRERRKRLRDGIEERSEGEVRLDQIGFSWNGVAAQTRAIEVEDYIAEIVKYKETQEQKHPGKAWDGHVPQSYFVVLEDGTKANVGRWVGDRKQDKKKRLRNGIQEKSLAEKRLDDIGILWDVRAVEVEEYIAEIVKYKDRQERLYPGKPWDGHISQSYTVTLKDGTTANVGTWVRDRKTSRRKRLDKGIKEKSLAEKRLDEIGILWEVIKTTRSIEVEEFIEEIAKYKEIQERRYPDKPWDGKVPESYSVILADGTKANVGTWVKCRKRDKKLRLRDGIEKKSFAEERLDEIGILWKVRWIEVEEYIGAILKYKDRQEQEDTGKAWDGKVPRSYSVILEDGTKANVGDWVNTQKNNRRNRLQKGRKEKSFAEKRLDEVGILWEVRRIEVEEYIAEILKYKETQEQKHPRKRWNGHVLRSYSVTLEDGTKAKVGDWVNTQKCNRRRRLEEGIKKKSYAEKRLDQIGILWKSERWYF